MRFWWKIDHFEPKFSLFRLLVSPIVIKITSMGISWPEQICLTIRIKIKDYRRPSFEKLWHIWEFRWKICHFWAQIFPISSPGCTHSDENHLYLGISWPEQTCLTISININDYRQLSFEKLRQIFDIRGKFGHFEPQISHFSSLGYPKNGINYLNWRVLLFC